LWFSRTDKSRSSWKRPRNWRPIILRSGGKSASSILVPLVRNRHGAGYKMDYLDGLYIGAVLKLSEFTSEKANDPAYFYLLSYPAHTTYPLYKQKLLMLLQLSSVQSPNAINAPFINTSTPMHKECQLVMASRCSTKAASGTRCRPTRMSAGQKCICIQYQ